VGEDHWTGVSARTASIQLRGSQPRRPQEASCPGTRAGPPAPACAAAYSWRLPAPRYPGLACCVTSYVRPTSAMRNPGPPGRPAGLLDELPGVICRPHAEPVTRSPGPGQARRAHGRLPFPFDELGRLGAESRLRLNYRAKGFRYPGKSAGDRLLSFRGVHFPPGPAWPRPFWTLDSLRDRASRGFP
jgi:hypothetical protein